MLLSRVCVAVIATALALPILPAVAEEPRTVDMTKALTGLDGKPIPDGTQAIIDEKTGASSCAKCEPLTLGVAVAQALCGDTKATQGDTALAKMQRCLLGQRLLGDKGAVLKASEVTEIINHFGGWSPVVAASALPMLDPALALKKP